MGLPSIQLIAKERVAQISDGHDAAYDDQHESGELTLAAVGLLMNGLPSFKGKEPVEEFSDWDLVQKFGDNKVRALTVAGALISAELDRVLRAEAKGSVKESKGSKKSTKKNKAKK